MQAQPTSRSHACVPSCKISLLPFLIDQSHSDNTKHAILFSISCTLLPFGHLDFYSCTTRQHSKANAAVLVSLLSPFLFFSIHSPLLPPRPPHSSTFVQLSSRNCPPFKKKKKKKKKENNTHTHTSSTPSSRHVVVSQQPPPYFTNHPRPQRNPCRFTARRQLRHSCPKQHTKQHSHSSHPTYRPDPRLYRKALSQDMRRTRHVRQRPRGCHPTWTTPPSTLRLPSRTGTRLTGSHFAPSPTSHGPSYARLSGRPRHLRHCPSSTLDTPVAPLTPLEGGVSEYPL
ncbi:hypothetical protein BKA57DRAFT_287533 [Linnemannia elongata]|nr:hypothetical protein BKA57DRAFT_287533 [Linnemannia elongata]